MEFQESDSDDSAFLFTASQHKRKAGKSIISGVKRLKLNKGGVSETINNVLDQEVIIKDLAETSLRNHCKNNDLDQSSCQWNVKDNSNELCPLGVVNNSTPSNEQQIKPKADETQNLVNPILDYFSCPLCLKNFESKSVHIAHLKSCRKRCNMTPKQLLEALELHKKQLQEKIILGIPLSLKKKKKPDTCGGSGSTDELALALALSKSLSEESHTAEDNLESNFNCTKVGTNKTTLESFGFTSTGKNCDTYGKRKCRSLKFVDTLLKRQTKEERERLITEKAAVVLLDEDNTHKIPDDQRKDLLLLGNSRYLKEREAEATILWELSANEKASTWYVEELKKAILDGKEIVEGAKVDEDATADSDSFLAAVTRLNLPKTTVAEDWKKLINNKHLSDLTIKTKDSRSIFAHSVVAYARCPSMLDIDLETIFSKFNSTTVLTFFNYLYCGVLDDLRQSEIGNLLDLARSVNYRELSRVLCSLMEMLEDSKRENNVSPLPNEVSSTDTIFPSVRVVESNECGKQSAVNDDLEDNVSIYVSSGSPQSDVDSTSETVIVGADDQKDGNDIDGQSWKNRQFQDLDKLENPHLIDLTQDNVITESPRAENGNGGKCDETKEVCVNVEYEGSCREMLHFGSRAENAERDMFEEMECSYSVNSGGQMKDESEIKTAEDEIDVIVSDATNKSPNQGGNAGVFEDCEEKDILHFEVPYFDPYEHFISESPLPESPVPEEENMVESQSLLTGEISPLKAKESSRGTYDNTDCGKTPTKGGRILGPGCSSTPINEPSFPPALSEAPSVSGISGRCTKRRKTATPCWKIRKSLIRSSSKSKLSRSRLSREAGPPRNSKIVNADEGTLTSLTDSIVEKLNETLVLPSRETVSESGTKMVEVTPSALSNVEYSEDVSPLPDYSRMGGSTIKQHLTKFGLKRSLSKNKAKKILRLIYDELHPFLNTKNGKIVKCMKTTVDKKSAKKKGQAKERKEPSRGKSSSTLLKSNRKTRGLKKKSENTSRVKASSSSSPIRERKSVKRKNSPDRERDCSSDSSSGSDASLDRTLEDSSEGSEFEIEEPLSQANYSSALDAERAVFDYIHSDPDLRKRILMYEPIWLEDFKKKLYEKYQKKFKLTDLMDCLDAEETKRRQQAEAAERRLREQQSRGIKDPQRLKERTERLERLEKKHEESARLGGDSNALKWTVD